jgi:hypothetical protein
LQQGEDIAYVVVRCAAKVENLRKAVDTDTTGDNAHAVRAKSIPV